MSDPVTGHSGTARYHVEAESMPPNRLPTSGGPVWAKAVPPFMCLDADVIDTVRRYDETLAPAVLGIDRAGRRSLLAHAPGEDCYQTDETTVREVVRRWVGVQPGSRRCRPACARSGPGTWSASWTGCSAGRTGHG